MTEYCTQVKPWSQEKKKKKCAKQEMVGLKKHYFWQRGIEKMSHNKGNKGTGII